MRSKSRNIAVLGGGLQGSCIAMELAALGARVDLYERNSACVAEASENNEGKVHLGYVYANDVSFETARLMATGGLSFERLMRRWVGARLDRLCVSAPFHYVVHRESLISPDQFAAHARKVAAFVSEQADRRGCLLFRSRPQAPAGARARTRRYRLATGRKPLRPCSAPRRSASIQWRLQRLYGRASTKSRTSSA